MKQDVKYFLEGALMGGLLYVVAAYLGWKLINWIP
jgi:hypothetical protein